MAKQNEADILAEKEISNLLPEQPVNQNANLANTDQTTSNTDSMQDLAISAEEKTLLDEVRKKIMEIKLEACDFCHEKWFDLEVQMGKCKKC